MTYERPHPFITPNFAVDTSSNRARRERPLSRLAIRLSTVSTDDTTRHADSTSVHTTTSSHNYVVTIVASKFTVTVHNASPSLTLIGTLPRYPPLGLVQRLPSGLARYGKLGSHGQASDDHLTTAVIRGGQIACTEADIEGAVKLRNSSGGRRQFD